MDRFFVTKVKNQVMDVNAHNEKEQIVIKHPIEEKWAVKVLANNKYIKGRLEGVIVNSLPEDWNK